MLRERLKSSDADVLNLLRESCASSASFKGPRGKQLKVVEDFAEQLQRRLRLLHRQLVAMAPLVSLQDRELEKSLQRIVIQGWDSTLWPDGHNLLHFLCEHGDARAVRLVAELCPDLEVRDGQHLRAMDYALKNPNAQVAEELLAVSQERIGLREASQAIH